jgi:hypothetical protein
MKAVLVLRRIERQRFIAAGVIVIAFVLVTLWLASRRTLADTAFESAIRDHLDFAEW